MAVNRERLEVLGGTCAGCSCEGLLVAACPDCKGWFCQTCESLHHCASPHVASDLPSRMPAPLPFDRPTDELLRIELQRRQSYGRLVARVSELVQLWVDEGSRHGVRLADDPRRMNLPHRFESALWQLTRAWEAYRDGVRV